MIDTGDVRAICLGELHGDRADASRGAVDQDPRTRRYTTLGQVVQSDEAGGWHGRRLLEADAGWLERHPHFGGRGVLGERTAVAPLDTANSLSEDLVTWLEPGHRAAHRIHYPSDVGPGHGLTGASDPGAHEAEHRGPAKTTCHTSGWTEAARTRTNTSSAAGAGRETSLTVRSSTDP